MNALLLMLLVTACYTYTTLNDKHAIAISKLSGSLFTFLMCSSMAVFLLICLPFTEVRFDFSLQAFVGVLLMVLCKLAELFMSAVVLRVMSAFELKAWIGITLFASYATDVFYGTPFRPLSLIFITVTVIGLVFIVRSEKSENPPYRKIILPLVLYLLSKYSYGLIIKAFMPHASSTVLLFIALVVISIILLPTVKLSELREKRKGVCMVVLARIPNTVGMLAENAVAVISLASYSFIQPMILVTLFFIRVIRREDFTAKNIVGGIICIIGLVAFQLFK